MANRRLLSKSISTSMRVSFMSEFAQLLFTWMIPHTDDFGRMDGQPEVVKALVMPLSKRKSLDFVNALKQMEEFGLISWYQESEKIVIEVQNSDEHQSALVNKRTKSRFPNRTDSSKTFQEFLGSSKNYRPILTYPNLTKPIPTKPIPTKPDLPQSEWKGDSFKRFWDAYPNKVAKQQAERAWRKLDPNEQLTDTILQAVERAKTSDAWRKDGGKFIPYPASWLNARRWEDQGLDFKALPLLSPAPRPKILDEKEPTPEEREASRLRMREATAAVLNGKTL